MVKCPFNPAHVMTQSALQRHLIRCMVNYPDYVVCPYNALHRFKTKELLSDHMMQCDSRHKVYMFHELTDVNKTDETCVHVDNIRDFNLQYENWDEN